MKARVFPRMLGKRPLGWRGARTRRVIQFSSLSTWLALAGLEAYCYRAKIVRGRADETMLVWMQGVVLESAAPTKSAKSTECLDRLDSPRLDKKDCWSGHWGSGSHANRGGNRQRRFVQLQVRRGKSAAQIFRRTRAGRWTVQARQGNSSRGHADETALV